MPTPRRFRRLLFMPTLAAAAVCWFAPTSFAQAPAPQGQPVDLPLAITPPAGMHVTLEVDARNADVLGLVKDLLNGLTPDAKPKPATAPTKTAKGTKGAKKAGKKTTAPAPKAAASAKGSGNEFVDMLQETGLTDVLRPISHLHILAASYEGVPAPDAAAKVADYETTFKSEGGHRLVWSDDNKSQLLIMGFDAPRKQFALVSKSGKQITIVRADGYPDVKKLSKLITMFAGD